MDRLKDVGSSAEIQPVLCTQFWPDRCFLAHGAEAGMAVVDHDERFTYVNPAFAVHLGFQVEELCGMSLEDLTDETEFRRIQAQSRRRRTGEKSRYECTLRHRQGHPVRILVSASPVHTPDGRSLGTVAVVVDLTERLRVEAELRARVADEHAIRQISSRCVNLPATEVDEAINWSLGLIRDRVVADSCSLALLQNSGLMYRMEYESCAPGVAPVASGAREIEVGSMPWARQQIEERGYVVVGGDRVVPEADVQRFVRAGIGTQASVPLTIGGEFLGVLNARMIHRGRTWNNRDLGLMRMAAEILANTLERRRVEEEMARARDLAEAGERARSQFLANMSHEIRTPMNAVIGVSDLLAGTELDAEQEQLVATITDSGRSLLRIVNDILDFSKIEAGAVSLLEDEFDVAKTVAGVVDLLRPEAEAKDLALSVVPGGPIGLVWGDEGRVRQALTNLVGNAIKFTDEGEVRVAVEDEGADAGARQVRFEVQDTGRGIDPSEHVRLFDPFVQLDGSSTRQAGGTGLGLAICRRLVKLMGGEIGVRSRRGQGATFWFTVRFNDASDRDAPAGQEPGSDAAKPWKPDSNRILVVEDNVVNQRILLKMIERFGGVADVAGDGYKALDALSETDYGLVLMDCQMPNLDGFQTTRQIRRLEPMGRRLPIVALTANAMEGDRERCLAAGMDDYVTKPVTMEAVKALLNRWLGADAFVDPAPPRDDDVRYDLPILDLDHLHPLSGGDRRFETRLLTVFLEEASEKVPAIVHAVSAGEVTTTAEVAHALKGAAASVGARRLADMAAAFHEAGRTGDLTPVRDLVGPLSRQLESVRAEITAIYDIDS